MSHCVYVCLKKASMQMRQMVIFISPLINREEENSKGKGRTLNRLLLLPPGHVHNTSVRSA